MLELVILGRQISRDAYDQTFPAMGTQLSSLQPAARSAACAGDCFVPKVGAPPVRARRSTILAEALDPRGFKVHPVMPANEVEQFYPWMQRFWNASPPTAGLPFSTARGMAASWRSELTGVCPRRAGGRLSRRFNSSNAN